jgi:hypothetical protein
MIVVAAFAANVAGVPAPTITVTRRRTRSAASAGSFEAKTIHRLLAKVAGDHAHN